MIMMTDKVSMLTEDIETIWNYSKYHIGSWIEMYTTDRVMMRRYEKFSQKYPDHCKLIREDQYSMTFTIDPVCMGFKPRAPRRAPALTEDQKQANSEQLGSIRQSKLEK